MDHMQTPIPQNSEFNCTEINTEKHKGKGQHRRLKDDLAPLRQSIFENC